MKKAFLLFSLVLVTATSYGQEQFFRFGPKIGVSSTDIKIKDNIDDIRYNLESGDAKLGFHAGLFARLSFLGLYVQPEALFTSAGGRIRIADVDGEAIKNYTLNKLDVPVMIGNKFGPFRLQVGPVFSMILNENVKENIMGTIDEIKQGWREASAGYQVGLGLDIGKLILDFKYEGNLSKMGNAINIGGQQFNTDMRNNQLIFSLGISLF